MRLAALSSRLCRSLTLFLTAALGLAAHAQTSVQIHDIMVAGANPIIGTAATRTLPYSPYYGVNVSVTGIVVGVESTGDYAGTVYISEPSANWDSAVLTAEGMPVFNMASLNSACAVVGANVTVVGTVVLSTAVVPADVTAANTPGTGILPTSCTISSTGTMTQSISVGGVLTAFGDALKYTGMTTNATFYAVAPTTGTTAAATGTVTSTGQFWATLSSNTATNNHLFRSTGIAGDEYYPTGSTAPTWAGNPQRVLIDTTTFGGAPVNITVGQTITCTTGANIKVGATAGIGLIDYTLGYARLLIFPTSVCTVGGTVASTTSAVADSTHFKVGTLDLNAFSSANPTFSTRLSKAATAIVTNLGSPDILSLQEVSDLATLTTLSNAVNTLGSTSYVPYLVPGAGSTNVGFLVKSSTLTTDSVALAPGALAATYTTASGTTATLWDSPPLVLKAEFVRIGKNYPVTVIDALMSPRDNSGDTSLGPNIRLRRAAQASAISQLVQTYQTAGQNVVVAGNLNAFEFSDGYVDVTGIIDGSPATAVSTYQATSTTAALTDFNTQVTALQRYNFIERGDAVTYEHVLASATIPDPNTAAASLASYVSTVTQPHFTADYYATSANTITTTNPAAGLTPHDGFVVAFLIPPVPTTASITPASMNFGGIDLTGTSPAMTATVTNTTTFVSTINITRVAISGTNAADFAQTSNCTSLTTGSTCTVSVTFSPSAIGARSAVLTVTNDSTSDPTLTVALSGTGLDTTATISPIFATFPSTDIGGTSTFQTFTVTNTSAVNITLGTYPAITGDYAITATTCSSAVVANKILTAGATCTVTVVFSPTAVGTRPGTLTVTDTSTANPTLTATLNGIGLDTTATLTPASLAFPSTYLGDTSATQSLTFTNTSTVPVTLSAISYPFDFTGPTAATCGTIAAGATCTVPVTFAPVSTLGAISETVTFTDSSTGNPTLTATLNGTSLQPITVTPSSLTFPNTSLGGAAGPMTLTVTNNAKNAATLQAIAITGDYTQTSTCGTSLAGGATCTIAVTFTPTALGTRTGTVSVTNVLAFNAGTLAHVYPYTTTIPLTGTALNTTATLTPASATFTSTDAGGTSPTQTFTVTNTSTIAINVKAIAPTGNFTQTATTCSLTATLAANATCTVTVAFTPLSVGALSGTLVVTTNTSGNPTLTSTLNGTGLDTTATLTPATTDFGSIYAGGGLSTARIFTLTNTSAIPISVKTVTIAGNFTQTNACPATLAAGASCTLSVIFAPLTSGALTGTLTVTTSTTANPTLIATLTGTGLPTTAAFTPTSFTYVNTIVGMTSTAQVYTWTNTSAIPLTIKTVTTTGDFTITANTCSGLINAGTSCAVAVTFTPTALGARTGSVSVASTSSANPTLTSTLAGRGVADVEANVNALNFGNIDLGSTSPTQTLTITNYTAAPINFTGFSITGDYKYTTTCSSIIGSLSNCTVTIQFTPTALGARPGTFTINTSDTKYPVIAVALTGNGVDFALSVSPTSGSTLAGYNSGTTLTINPLGGFNAPITISCTTNAGGSTCLPAVSSTTLSATTTMAVAITTTSQYTVIGYSGLGLGSHPLLYGLALLSTVVLFIQKRKRRLPRLLAALAFLVVLGGANLGCGTRDPDKNANPTLPGTYTYTISATDGTLTRSATYTLNVAIRY